MPLKLQQSRELFFNTICYVTNLLGAKTSLKTFFKKDIL